MRGFQFLVAGVIGGALLIGIPRETCRMKRGPDMDVLQNNLYRHVETLSVEIGDRHLWKEGSLKRAEEYIQKTLGQAGYEVMRQTFTCYGRSVSNLIAKKRGREQGIIVVGAHYDTVPGTPGADDNASAVAGMLELARLLKDEPTQKSFTFAAFVNEEPPCFGSPNMGSMVYAGSLREKKAPVEFMVCLEMIGFYSDQEIQRYPLPGMGLFYPKKADFIGVAGNVPSFRVMSLIRKGIRRHSRINARSLIGPEFLGGINLSDNSSFWYYGYRAVMVTDSSFYRNRHYHQETDTIDTLDFQRMSEVIRGLYFTLRELH